MRKALLLVLAAALAAPAAAQIDFTRFVQIGDSFTGGYLDACWVEHGQRNAYGAWVAAAGGGDFQQPLLKEPGVGTGVGPGKGCLVLASLLPSPTFTHKDSVVTPLNLTLPRPYNNLAVPGYRIKDVADSHSSAENGNPLTDLVLRGQGTALAQAAALHPTFVTVLIGNIDILGAIASGTVIEGLTLTPLEVAAPKIKQILDTLKASQGTARGVVLNVPDLSVLPFVSAIPPVITVAGHTFTDPLTGQPMTYLSQKVELVGGVPTGKIGPVAPIPVNSLLTLNAAAYLASGTGVPCAIFTAGGIPAGDPRRANCDKPLPDDLDPVGNTPGVVLYPDEIALAAERLLSINDALSYFADQDGYAFYDTFAFFDDLKQNGRNIGGVQITTDFLSGGFFSYDGVHPTSLGQALLARDFLAFLNAQFGANLPDIDLSPFFTGGSAGAGLAPAAVGDRIAAAATLFPAGRWPEMKKIFGLFDPPALTIGGEEPPLRDPRHGRDPLP